MGIHNKVVLINCATFGLGEAIALSLSKSYRNLVLIDKNAQDLDIVAEKCKTHGENKIIKIVADISEDTDIRRIIEATVENFNRIDLLINCSFTFFDGNTIIEDTSTIYNEVMKGNLKNIKSLTYAMVPHLLKNNGTIIHVSTIVAESLIDAIVPYNLNKAALTRFTEGVILDPLLEGVKIKAIHPGPTIRNLSSIDSTIELFDKETMSDNLKYFVEPKEIAELVLYLLNDKYLIHEGNVIDAASSFIH